MNRWVHVFVVAAGWLSLAAIAVILFAGAYLRSGHPPASGIVALATLILVQPVAIVASIVAALAKVPPEPAKAKSFYLAAGWSMAFALCGALVFVLKALLHRPL